MRINFPMRLRFLSMMLIAGCVIVSQGRHAQAGDFTVVQGLHFSEAAASLTLDLYLPPASADRSPCVIVIQGGGFRPQNGQRFKPFAEHLAKHGFAAALISYRGSPEHRYRDTLADVKASVRFIRKVADKYQIDAERIGATGRSAGGTLAALLAVTGDDDDPDSRIRAAVCFAGVFDFVSRFTKQEQLHLQPNSKNKLKTNGEWIGPAFSTDDPEWLAASAITHVDPSDPPILFLHSRDDSTVPWLQSRDMHRAMTDAGLAAEIRVYETGGHSVSPKDRNSLGDMVEFFRTRL
ncbi:alpha/beta hydrolase [Stieleria sp. ICT_E10.1]|uniref:alpha/beta hydrolase n=1 Tax=Stieleria sedimenti TaxID=2976331 RepID=UPI0021800EDA|nr:alpha/beta hydrolase [Stieleria sedimenti]MCS7465706.1 alpha/beta hydrolase [Stieleria sedimenti]